MIVWTLIHPSIHRSIDRPKASHTHTHTHTMHNTIQPSKPLYLHHHVPLCMQRLHRLQRVSPLDDIPRGQRRLAPSPRQPPPGHPDLPRPAHEARDEAHGDAEVRGRGLHGHGRGEGEVDRRGLLAAAGAGAAGPAAVPAAGAGCHILSFVVGLWEWGSWSVMKEGWNAKQKQNRGDSSKQQHVKKEEQISVSAHRSPIGSRGERQSEATRVQSAATYG